MILVIIPAYNAAKNISRVVQDAKKYAKHILIVDDGSTDNTYSIAKAIKGINVIKHDKNMGKGHALRTGFEYALKNNFRGVITLDSDGQHDPSEISKFLENKEAYDIIIGNRMNNIKKMPKQRIFSNAFSSFIISLLAKQKIKDTHSGYRFIKSNVLKEISLSCSRFNTESELLVKAGRKGFKIGHVDIKTIYSDQKSNINPFTDTLRFIGFVAKNIILRH